MKGFREAGLKAENFVEPVSDYFSVDAGGAGASTTVTHPDGTTISTTV